MGNQNKERPVCLSAKIIKFKNGFNFLTKICRKIIIYHPNKKKI